MITYFNKGAIFSDCRQYRYLLWRIWDDKKPCIMFIMLNPSTADENEDDSTIRKCIQFAKWLGYGGIYVGNLFSYRSTNPAELRKSNLLQIDILGKDNDRYLEKVAEKCEKIIFAWGDNGKLFNRDKDMMKLFPHGYCLGRTMNNNPKHPLYLSNSIQVQSFKL
jgi:hypothetical protein